MIYARRRWWLILCIHPQHNTNAHTTESRALVQLQYNSCARAARALWAARVSRHQNERTIRQRYYLVSGVRTRLLAHT